MVQITDSRKGSGGSGELQKTFSNLWSTSMILKIDSNDDSTTISGPSAVMSLEIIARTANE